MCSIFDFKISKKFLKDRFNISLEQDISGRAHPYSLAPVIIGNVNSSEYRLAHMNFSLVPHWSKEKKVKFATHNARLYGEDKTPIFEKPSWKVPFTKNHCLVVMDSFLESVHDGPYAGNVIAFKNIDNSPLIAAGIYDQWLDTSTGEVLESFSILTHDPPKFVMDAGHDRCPVFLNKNASLRWPFINSSNPQAHLDFLLNNIENHQYTTSIDRPLKNYNGQTEFKF